MDIGREKEIITVEPVEEPGRVSEPAAPEPVKAPDKAPAKEPVPA